MIELHDIPNDLDACQALLRVHAASVVEQSATIASQALYGVDFAPAPDANGSPAPNAAW